MTAFASTRTLTDDVIAALEAAGLAVGDGDGVGLSAPYVVVAPVTGQLDGTVAAPDSESRDVIQATGVGGSRQQAEWVRDKARQTVLGGVVLTGRSLYRATLYSSTFTRQDEVEPSLFLAVDRFGIWHGPA